MLKENQYTARTYSDYLRQSSNHSEYNSRVSEISSDIGFSDISVAEFDPNVQVLRHFQTASSEMLEKSFDPNKYNLIGLQAVKQPGVSTFLSDTVDKVEQLEMMGLFTDVLHSYEVINDFGYSDYHNWSFATSTGTTILISLSTYDLSATEFRKRIRRKTSLINYLHESVRGTYLPTSRLLSEITPGEIEVIRELADCDEDIEDIAKRCNLSKEGFKSRLKKVRKRAGITRHGPLVALALREGVID
jgi:predicted DNA-binding protein (UPF0251 family)